jgi:hypothetical protein
MLMKDHEGFDMPLNRQELAALKDDFTPESSLLKRTHFRSTIKEKVNKVSGVLFTPPHQSL